MKILLTGATGFLGSYLAKALIEDGHQMIALKRARSSLVRLGKAESEIRFYDVENLDIARPFKENAPIDAVIHTATCYGRSESPMEVFNANTEFPLRLLATALDFSTEFFLNTDTFFNTDTILAAYLDTYSLSKKHFADWGRILCDESQIRFLNIRLEHLYGPDDDPRKFIPWIVRECLNNVPAIKLTGGEQERDFVYIKDVVSAYRCLLVNRDNIDRGFTQLGLGTGEAVSLRHVVETVHRHAASTSRLNFGALPYRKGEAMHSCADPAMIASLGWTPSYTIEKGLAEVSDAAAAQLYSTNA